MKFPAKPPDLMPAFQAVARNDSKRLATLLANSNVVDARGRYLHWDQMRFRKPPADLTVEEWWIATRLARASASQRTALTDSAGNAFTFCEPPPLRAVLRDLDMDAGGSPASDGAALSPGEGRLHLARSLAEEPFASSFIEGAATTRKIAKQLILEGREPRTKDERMVLNNYRAMQFVKDHKGDRLTLPMLLELHRVVTSDTLDNPPDAGKIRTSDDIQVVDETNNELLFQPPLASELGARLESLFKFANKKREPGNWVHPLLKAFILHFMLSYEHPFVDGNGRVARALFYWSALRDGYWLIEYVSISSVIAESIIQYGRSFLHAETDAGDLTYFLVHQAKILRTAIDRLMEYVDRKRKEVAAFEKRLGDKHRPDAFNRRQSWLLNEFARGRLARVTVSEHQERNAVSYLTARNDLEALIAAGCLQKSKAGKLRVYQPVRDLMKILAAD